MNDLDLAKEAIDLYATLVQMHFDGSWDFNSYMRIKEGPEIMEDAVHWLEINAGVKINKKEVE